MTVSIPDATRRIELLPMDSIPRAPRNPKAHELAKLRASMAKYGCTVAGILDERTGRLVAGHGRLDALKAMQMLGTPPPQGVSADGDDWLVPVVRGWASVNDAEAEAYLIIDNRIPEQGGWDKRMLAEVLEDLAEYDLDLLDIAGYSGNDLDRMVASIVGDRDEPPSEFPAYDEHIETKYSCPKCGYDWSGKPN